MHNVRRVAGIALAALWISGTTWAADDGGGASSLLAVDQNRATVIERIVRDWGPALAQSSAEIGESQLREMLMRLRADHLLAASLAGSLSGLREVLTNALASTAPASSMKVAGKAVGAANADLTYTPVSPCRLFDTRPSQGGGGVMQPNVRRSFGAVTPVPSQGGPGGCAAGGGSAVALIQIGTVSPTGSGFLQGGAQGVQSFPNALILYQAGDQYGTAVAMPLNAANGQFDVQVQFAATDLYGDLLGYFRPAAGAITGQVALCTGDPSGSLAYIQGMSYSAFTGSSGAFQLSAVPAGTYTLALATPGTTLPAKLVPAVVVGNGAATNVGTTILSDLNTVNNCGACGTVCAVANGVPACANGVCGLAGCNAGFSNCDNNPGNGCETNTNVSLQNCGSCGNACPTPANATPFCTNGACGSFCNAGFVNCSNVCRNLANDPANCGSCGHGCAVNQACVSGQCI